MGMRIRSGMLLLAVLIAPGCDLMPCNNHIVRKIRSPDGRHDAVMFQRSCGATTGFTTQVSVVAHGAAPSGGSNLFVADNDHGKTADTPWHGPWADVRWRGPDRLRIVYDANARVFGKAGAEDGVQVEYAVAERPPAP